MQNKKGLSPLIATLLLVAFAVALGAMIINIGSGIASSSISCDKLQISVQNHNSLCYDDINSISNAQFKSANNIAIDEIVFKEIIEKQGEYVNIDFIPQLMKNGKLISCSEKKISIPNIPSC